MPLDLTAYFHRIEYGGGTAPTAETLQALHLAHATHIPFENLDVLLGRAIRLDSDSIFAKLVTNKRGGYCFEQNRLFALVLKTLGFPVTCISARVQLGSTEPRPRTHMLLSVEVNGAPWLTDVGFGSEGLLHPLPLAVSENGEKQFAWQYRITGAGPIFTLQSMHAEGWFDLYRLTLEPQFPIDYELANHYTSTHPESRFVLNRIVARPGPEQRVTLWNDTLMEQTPTSTSETKIASDAELMQILETRFALNFPPGTKFPTSTERRP